MATSSVMLLAAIAFARCEAKAKRKRMAGRPESEVQMKRLEKMARRALHWADVYRTSGDKAGEAFAMQRYRKAQRRLNAMVAAAFTPHLDLGVLG